jgi:hypothetical protein
MRHKDGNSTFRHTRKPWPTEAQQLEIYDELPREVRRAMQEGPDGICPVYVRRLLRRLLRGGDTQHAISATAEDVWAFHAAEIRAGGALWYRKRKTTTPSPHVLADATMQTYGNRK